MTYLGEGLVLPAVFLFIAVLSTHYRWTIPSFEMHKNTDFYGLSSIWKWVLCKSIYFIKKMLKLFKNRLQKVIGSFGSHITSLLGKYPSQQM